MPGRPIKVIWTREDDIQYTKPRPLTVQRLEAGLDAQGNLVAFHHRIVSESIYARFAPPAFEKAGGRDLPVCEGAFEPTYSYPNFELDYLREQRGIDVAVWRSVVAATPSSPSRRSWRKSRPPPARIRWTCGCSSSPRIRAARR
jgi:isoquinoline 1-oxidoreductase beta subunit